MEDINGQAQIYMDKDKLSAFLEVTPPSGAGLPCSPEAVKQAMAENNIIFGIDESKISEALLEPNWGNKILIAQGKAAIDGKDAIITYKFVMASDRLKPVEDEKGNVDFHETGLVYNIKRGEALVERVPPVPGEKGMDVQGRELMPRSGKDFALPRGKNTVCNEDNTVLYAIVDGHVSVNDRKVVVDPVFVLNGNVDFSSGNIDFVGNVIVNGSIDSGFTVKAQGDIEVKGFIEAAEVIAGGNVIVKGGIKSGIKGIVRAGESISARFVENARLEAGKDILVREAIMQSHIRAGGSVIVSDRRATIVGGVVQASQTVEAKILGSQLATQTIIEVGVNPYYRDEYQKLTKVRNETKKALDNLNSNLQIFQRAGVSTQDMSDKKRLTLIKMLDDYKKVKQDLTQQEERMQFLEEEFNRIQTARVRAMEVAYPGVRISIGSSIYVVNDAIKYTQFVLDEGEVRLTSLS